MDDPKIDAVEVCGPRPTLGLIGAGAFGSFAVKHLAPHFDVMLADPRADLKEHAAQLGVAAGDIGRAAMCDIVVLAVPVQKLQMVLHQISDLVQPGALIIDVASIKIGPAQLMTSILPAHVAIVGTHPLFGPQSGKFGIAGLNIAVCNVRGNRAADVEHFFREKLQLNVMRATPEEHDRELAYVQGLTHLLAKVVVALDLPEFRFTTKTYEHLQKMVEMVRHDSDELFRAIEKENPFAAEAKQAFFGAARKLEDDLNQA